MKKLLLLLLLIPLRIHADENPYENVSDSLYRMSLDADRADARNNLDWQMTHDPSHYLPADPGCEWVKMINDDGTSKRLAAEDGYKHKVFIEVCPDDPPSKK